jgi:hypothetical protein
LNHFTIPVAICKTPPLTLDRTGKEALAPGTRPGFRPKD